MYMVAFNHREFKVTLVGAIEMLSHWSWSFICPILIKRANLDIMWDRQHSCKNLNMKTDGRR